MTKRFKIENNPTFKEVVKIPRIGGEPIEVEFEFKYLTRKELASLYDSWQDKLNSFIKNISDTADKDFEGGNSGGNSIDNMSLLEATEMELNLSVDQIKDITVGWGFEDEFNDENIERLIESSLHVSKVITEAYQEAYTKVKLGN